MLSLEVWDSRQMDQLHDPILKQYITSMALSNSILKHTSSDNFCVIKNDSALLHPASKTVSLYLTRVPHSQSSYVHVLRCNTCDYLTLNPATLKEHVRNKHPSSLGFWTYSCLQCSSMSTEKSLMEEHLKLYHRQNDGLSGKLIERFHDPTAAEPQNTAVSITGAAIPFDMTGTPSFPGSLTVNLVNAVQSPGKVQAITPSIQSPNKTNASTLISSSPSLNGSPPSVASHSAAEAQDNSADDISQKTQPFSSISPCETGVFSSASSACAVSGSRRRKATTPGRICPQASTSVDHNSCLEDDVKHADDDSDHTKSDESAIDMEGSITDHTPISHKRAASFDESGVDSADAVNEPTTPTRPRSPKRPCTVDLTKSQSNQTVPLILSIGNTTSDLPSNIPSMGLNKPILPNITVCSQPMGSVSSANPVMGQLIPISGLPEHLLCGISTALLGGAGNPTTNTQITSATNTSGSLISLPMLENQINMTTPNASSTWLLTNQPTGLTASLQTANGASQPTLFMPVPAALGDTNMKPFSTQLVEMNSNGVMAGSQSTNLLRVTDLLELLKSFGAAGGLVSSINVPVSTATLNTTVTTPASTSSVNGTGSTVLYTTSNQPGPQTVASSLPTSTSSPGSRNLVNLVTSLTGTNPISTPSTITSTANAISPSLLFNQLVMAAVAAANSSTNGAIPSPNQLSDSTVVVTSGANRLPDTVPPEQALDMSVRSGTIPLGVPVSISIGPGLAKSSEGTGHSMSKVTEATEARSVITLPFRQDQTNIASLQGVMEALTAALKSGMKQRTSQTPDVVSSNTLSNSANCAAINTRSNSPGSVSKINTGSPTDHATSSHSALIRPQTTEVESVLNGSAAKTSLTTSHSILLPFVAQNLETASTVSGFPDESIDSGDPRPSTTQTVPSAPYHLTSSTTTTSPPPQMVSLAQLQAIMSAMANNGSISVTTPLVNALAATTSTTSTSQSVNLSSTNTAQGASTNVQNSSLLSANQVLLNASSLSSGTTGVIPLTDPNGTLLASASLANAAGALSLTATSGSPVSTAAIFSSNTGPTTVCTTPLTIGGLKNIQLTSGTEGLSLAGIISGAHAQAGQLHPTLVSNPALINLISSTGRPLTSQANVPLTSAAAVRLLNSLNNLTPSNGLLTAANTTASTTTPSMITSSSVPTGTLLGGVGLTGGSTLNWLDSSQALFAAAAAAASGNVNQISFNTLRGPTISGAIGTPRPLGANGSFIGLLDPRTGLQLRVADISGISSTLTSSLSASNELGNCLGSSGLSTTTSVFTHSMDDPAALRPIEPHAIGAGELRRKVTENDHFTKSGDLETASPYDTHLDDDWDSGHDDSVKIQNDLKTIYSSGIKTDPLADSAGSSPNLTSITSTLLSAVNRRNNSTSRSPLISGSSRRGVGSLGDPLQPGRPHRQNFTPTQNRILTEWYQTHQSKPYPSTDDTKELAIISGLSYSQVKKWFANKRARSSSSGLPKPTPPMAPDSSPDPSAAAAIVAAAMAAATSEVSTTDNAHYVNSVGRTTTPDSLTQAAATLVNNTNYREEAALGSEEGAHVGDLSVTQSCGSVGMASSTCTDDDDPPLTVVLETKVNTYKSPEQLDHDSGAPAEPICLEPIQDALTSTNSDHSPSDPVKPKSTNSGTADSAASPPTLQVHLTPRMISPQNAGMINSGYDSVELPDEANLPEEIPSSSSNDCATSQSSPCTQEVQARQETLRCPKSKGIRNRGVTLDAS
ncbi:homeobox protein extradenticle [Clonorchis sinensis]|uniref:Homeobox protein extradenticle n=1 Tax=Clonorchis sinensis TaxID=79923 RepID=H2KPA1_CLOSI|nr:homeobox protein extradenticle [Clonorchis sinensis]